MPYAVIHSALMDIAMDRQTYNEEKARPFTPAVFDRVQQKSGPDGGS